MTPIMALETLAPTSTLLVAIPIVMPTATEAITMDKETIAIA